MTDCSSCLILIPSNGRHNTAKSPALFPDAVLFVAKYKRKHKNQIHAIPDSLVGLARIKNYCIKTFASTRQSICMIDDDVYGCQCLAGKLLRKVEPAEMRDLINSTALCAKEAGLPLFGFAQSLDLTPYKPHEFIRHVGMVMTVVGVTGKFPLWDEELKCRMDADASLRAIREFRKVWIDTRYCFTFPKDINPGGLSVFRDADTLAADYHRILEKWGRYVGVYEMPDYTNVILQVKRKKPLGRFYKDLGLNAED